MAWVADMLMEDGNVPIMLHREGHKMSATISGVTLNLLTELEAATTEIIERHYAADEKRQVQTLSHYGPFDVRVYGADGYLARFLEEGLELYPDEDAK